MKQKASCILCGAEAEFVQLQEPIGYHTGKKFYCENCGEYVIDAHSEELFREMSDPPRDGILRQFSDAVKSTPQDEICIIREPLDEDARKAKMENSNTTVKAYFFKRQP